MCCEDGDWETAVWEKNPCNRGESMGRWWEALCSTLNLNGALIDNCDTQNFMDLTAILTSLF